MGSHIYIEDEFVLKITIQNEGKNALFVESRYFMNSPFETLILCAGESTKMTINEKIVNDFRLNFFVDATILEDHDDSLGGTMDSS